MPYLLSDGNARIDSKPDTSAFMRDRSQVLYAKVLTKYDGTKLVPYAKVMTPDKVRLHEMRPKFFVCGVVPKIREASRSKCTRDEKFARLQVRLDFAQDTI